MWKVKLLVIILFSMIFFSYPQCAMCRVVAESSQTGGGTIANGLNTGILYLMSFPYMLIVLGLIFLYFQQKELN